MRNPSVQLYSVRQEFGDDPLGTLRRIAEIGFRQVEPYGLVEHRAALETALPAQQLTAPTAHVKLVGADLPEVFAAAVACGVEVVIDPAVRAEHWQSAADVAEIAAALNDAAKAAAQHGLRVGYHNHWWELETQIDGRPALEVLADRLDPAEVLAAAPAALRVVEFDRYDGDIFDGLAESYAYLAKAEQ